MEHLKNMTLEQRLRRMEDYQEILELKARYCNTCDGGWDRPSHDYDAAVDLFTEDAVWDGRPGLPCVEGLEAIRTLMKGFREKLPFIIHYVMNPIITIEGDTATGHWHAIIHYRRSKGSGTSYAIYEETYVRTENGWRIQSLRVKNAAHLNIRDGVITPQFESDTGN